MNEYIILLPPDQMDSWKFTNPNFSKVAAPYTNYSFGEQVGFLRLLLSLKADLVHFAMPQQPILYFKPHVTTVHDLILLKTYNSDKNKLLFTVKQFIGRGVFYLVGRTSRHILVNSEYTKKSYLEFAKIPEAKTTLTYLGSAVGKVTPKEYSPLAGKQFLLYVGNQSDYKNIRRLMQAHRQLLQNNPELLLVLVGKLTGKNGVSLRLNKEWAEQQNFKNIVYTDFVPDEELAWIYQHCATYVFPSLMEGFGLPGLEAMSCGAPVTSSNTTCLPEVYGNAAHYFDPLDVNDMARAITEVLQDAQLRHTLVQRGYEQSKKYSWQRMAEQTLAVYKQALTS